MKIENKMKIRVDKTDDICIIVYIMNNEFGGAFNMRMLHNGENLNQKELYEIVDNFYVSKHARERIYERDMTIREMKSIIESPILAYYNTDGTINIAKDRYHYFVIAWNEGYNNFIIITYKEKSNNNIDIFEKQRMAQKGIDRLKRVC